MKIIITENQNYLLRRVQQFIEIVEVIIESYENVAELYDDGPWWCHNSNPDTFFESIMDRSIQEFIRDNWDFFHDRSKNGGSDMDISVLNKLVEQNYGNYIRNLFVRKCNYSRY
jgi:hypothetical protein